MFLSSSKSTKRDGKCRMCGSIQDGFSLGQVKGGNGAVSLFHRPRENGEKEDRVCESS